MHKVSVPHARDPAMRTMLDGEIVHTVQAKKTAAPKDGRIMTWKLGLSW